MKIAYVITRADEIGGAQVHVRDLATAMHEAGHQVTVIAGNAGALSEQLADHGVSFQKVPALVREIAPWREGLALRQLRTLLRHLRPDLVTTHSSKAGWLGRLAARSLGIPALFTAHGWAFTDGVSQRARRLYALAERMAAPFTDRIITVSQYDRGLALKERIAPPDKIICIHNGVHDCRPGSQPWPRTDPPQILMTGRFSAQKDHACLLRALAKLRNLNWVLQLAGDGDGEPRVKALAASLGLADRVRFLGQRTDVADLLRRSDIYALISNWEGLPYGILEAMSAGLPVVASGVGGVREAVVDEITGLVVPRADEHAVAGALARLIDDHQLRHRLGEAGRQRYDARFRFERMFTRTVGVYERTSTEAKRRASRRS